MLRNKIRCICGVVVAFLVILTYFNSEKGYVMEFPSTKKITHLLDSSKKVNQLNGDYSSSEIFLYSTEKTSIILVNDINYVFHALDLNGVYTNIVRIKNGGNEYIIFNKNNPKQSLKLTRYQNEIKIDKNSDEFNKNVTVTFEEKDDFNFCHKKTEGFYAYEAVFDSEDYFSLPGNEENSVYLLKDVDHLGL